MQLRLTFKNKTTKRKSHVGFEFTQTGEQQHRAFNDPVRVDNYKITSLGPNVATDKGKLITSAFTKAIDGLPKDQYFRLYDIPTVTKNMENLQHT